MHLSDFRLPHLEIRNFAFGKGRPYSGTKYEIEFEIEGSQIQQKVLLSTSFMNIFLKVLHVEIEYIQILKWKFF